MSSSNDGAPVEPSHSLPPPPPAMRPAKKTAGKPTAAAKKRRLPTQWSKRKVRPAKKQRAPPPEVSPQLVQDTSRALASAANDDGAPPAPPVQKAHQTTEADIDEILDESDDLLLAALEAQSMGRLAAAQTFLFLAHARLVGLGRWIERPHVAEIEVANGDCREDGAVNGGGVPLSSAMATPSPSNTASHNQHPRLPDKLALSAQQLLHKHGGRARDRKRTASNEKRKTKSGNGSEQIEMASDHNNAPVSSVRTVVICNHLDARSLVENGMEMEAEEDDSGEGKENEGAMSSVEVGDEGNTTWRVRAREIR